MSTKKTASQRGRAAREKGKAGEREAAKIFREAGYTEARRAVQFAGKGGGTADIIGVPGLRIEVKRVERLNVEAALQQAERDAAEAGDSAVPVVGHRGSGQAWKITMRLTDFLERGAGLWEPKKQ